MRQTIQVTIESLVFAKYGFVIGPSDLALIMGLESNVKVEEVLGRSLISHKVIAGTLLKVELIL